jgi:hypothetical protein
VGAVGIRDFIAKVHRGVGAGEWVSANWCHLSMCPLDPDPVVLITISIVCIGGLVST